MKNIQIDLEQFDGAKFAARYGLSFRDKPDGSVDFWVRGNVLHYPEHLPDAPIIEGPNPLPDPPTDDIDAVKANTANPGQTRKALKYLLEKLGE